MNFLLLEVVSLICLGLWIGSLSYLNSCLDSLSNTSVINSQSEMSYKIFWFKAVVFFNQRIIYLSVSILLSFEGSVKSSELDLRSFATIHYYVNLLRLFQLILSFLVLYLFHTSHSVFHLTLFLESLSVIFDCLFSCFIFLSKNEKCFQNW